MNLYRKRALPATLLSLLALGTQPTYAESKMHVDTKGGLSVFDINDEDYWFKVGGRVNFDYANFNGDAQGGYPSGSNIRRARLTMKGGVGSHWVYKIDIDHRTSGGAEFGEVFLAYDGFEQVWLAIGQVGSPFGLDNWTSSNESLLMENALISQAFTPPRGIGVYAEGTWTDFAWAASVITPAAGNTQIGDAIPAALGTNAPAGPARGTPGSDPYGATARLTYSPVHTPEQVYHLGTSFTFQDLKNRANLFNFSTAPELRARSTRTLSTLVPSDSVKDYWVWGAEAAWKSGPLLISGEYMIAHMDRFTNIAPTDARQPGGDLSYKGYYIAASYVLTGESHDYDFNGGTFGRVRPLNKQGAVELVARHSYINLKDKSFGLGYERDNTLGVTWWVNDHVRFLANYVHARVPVSLNNKNTLHIFGARAQVNW